MGRLAIAISFGNGKEDIRYDTVTDLKIQDERDAIIRVTSCAMGGSDLHLFHNFIPAMLPGDIMGHESMGEVVETGRGLNGTLNKGDRIVVPFNHLRRLSTMQAWELLNT